MGRAPGFSGISGKRMEDLGAPPLWQTLALADEGCSGMSQATIEHEERIKNYLMIRIEKKSIVKFLYPLKRSFTHLELLMNTTDQIEINISTIILVRNFLILIKF